MTLPVHVVDPVVLVAHVVPHELSDAELGAEAALSADRAESSRIDSAEQARRCGELLVEARERCRRDRQSFNAWLARHWKKSRATAYTFILVASEVQLSGSQVQQNSVQRAGQLLQSQSVRAFLVNNGHSHAGVRRAKDGDIDLDAAPDSEQAKDEADRETIERVASGEMREPGADEDEDMAPAPAALPQPTRHLSPKEAARKVEEARQKAQADAEERDAARKAAHEQRIKNEQELAQINEAEKRPAGPPPPMRRPDPEPKPVGPYSVKAALDAIREDTRDVKRRIDTIVAALSKVVHYAGAPYVDANGFEGVDPRDEDYEAIRAAFAPLVKPWDNAVIERVAILLTNHAASDAAYIARVLDGKLHTQAGQKRRGK